MPRQNDVGELAKRITRVELIRPVIDSTGAIVTETTVSETIEEAEVDLTVAAITGFTANAPVILVGDGGVECNQVTTATSGVITTVYKAEAAHATGARLILAEKILLGEVESGGFSINASQSSTDIESATSDLVLATDVGPLTLDFSCGLLGQNIPNELLWLNQREKERGAGTASDPYQGGVGFKGRDIVGPIVIRCSGIRRDGKLFHWDCLNATITPSGSKSLGRGGTSSYPITGRITHLMQRIWAP